MEANQTKRKINTVKLPLLLGTPPSSKGQLGEARASISGAPSDTGGSEKVSLYYGREMYFHLQLIPIDVQPDNFKSIQENHDDQERMKLYFFTFLTFCFKDAAWCPL